MNALVRKEIRLILPAWIAAMALAVLPAWLIPPAVGHGDQSELTGLCFGLGVLLLSLAPFGQEFSCGTFSQMLSQPYSRIQYWRVKWVVLLSAVIPAALGFLISCHARALLAPNLPKSFVGGFENCGIYLLALVTGGIWTTLLFRQIAAALWIAMLAPLSLVCVTALLGIEIFHVQEPLPKELLFVVLGVYAVASFCAGRHLFLRAQDSQWTGGILTVPLWLGLKRRGSLAARPAKFQPVAALCWKELQIHQISLLLAALFFLLNLGILAIRRINPDLAVLDRPPGEIKLGVLLAALMVMWFILWMVLPFLIGCTAVAEERKFGTLESQLCLPVKRSVQLAVKLCIAMILGITFGAVMPWALENLGAAIGIKAGGIFGENPGAKLKSLEILAALSGAVVFLCVYASTLTRNLLQAMGTAVVVGCALFGATAWAALLGSRNAQFYLWKGPLILWIGLPLLVAALLWLSHRNISQLQVRWIDWFRNGLVLLLTLLAAGTATALLYQRTWEFAMQIEPRHGPPQLSGRIRPQICFSGPQLFALLPDGRLWVATRYTNLFFGSYYDNRQSVQKVLVPVPTDGTFVGNSNWLHIANSRFGIVGIQQNGTLWNVFRRAQTKLMFQTVSALATPQQIGADSDWQSVSGGWSHFLALKKDGSAWGWGDNHRGQLGPGPQWMTNEWQRVGNDSDWIEVFASGSTSFGVKRDGTVWKWGETWGRRSQTRYDYVASAGPERCGFQGTNWSLIEQVGWPADIALERSGVLWVDGNVPQFLASGETSVGAGPRHLGNTSDWADVGSVGDWLGGLKTDGSIVGRSIFSKDPWGRNIWHISRYSDWLAVAEWFNLWAALGEDGTLCYWDDPFDQMQENMGHGARLLGPTRRPVWDLNILARAKGSESASSR